MINLRLGLIFCASGFCVSGLGSIGASAAETTPTGRASTFNTVVIQGMDSAAMAKKGKGEQKTDTGKLSPSKASGTAETAGSRSAAATVAPANGKDAGVGAKASPSPANGAKAQGEKSGKDIEAGGTAKVPPEPTDWPVQEIELAKARCKQLLKGIEAVTLPEAPFRKGECGTPAPVRLISLGKKPEVSFSPPPLLTCDMVVALSKWVSGDLKLLARKHLGGDLIEIETMSDYSCRKAYGRIGNKLSEHGKANALDIRGFVTNKGREAIVLTGWGETKRDRERLIAAAKAAEAKEQALKAAAEKAEAAKIEAAKAESSDAHTVIKAAAEVSGAAGLPRATIIEGVPGISIQTDGLGVLPTHLGGPTGGAAKAKPVANKDTKAAAKEDRTGTSPGAADAIKSRAPLKPGIVAPPPKPPAPTPTMAFLRDAHKAACRIFGTTLGPEANEAHRNHLHIDMAERKVDKICK